MSTFYLGKRPVLKGRNGEVTNTYTHKVGVYSNWDLMNPSHVLDGAPDHNVVPGAGLYPHGLQMSRWFTGKSQIYPLAAPGLGPRQDSFYFRQAPLQWKGVAAAKALGNPGHIAGTGPTVDYRTLDMSYHGVPADQLLKDSTLGHTARAWNTAISGEGPTQPFIAQGVDTKESRPLKTPGATYADHRYGHEHTREYFGVPSAKAL